jgi:hypothetical protein
MLGGACRFCVTRTRFGVTRNRSNGGTSLTRAISAIEGWPGKPVTRQPLPSQGDQCRGGGRQQDRGGFPRDAPGYGGYGPAGAERIIHPRRYLS